jgi:putative protein-disulfide isomerase
MENIKEALSCNEERFCETPTSDNKEHHSTKDTSAKKSKLMYFGDPMCSWCWGLTHHLEKTIAHFEDPLDFEIIMGGLRVGDGEAWNDQMKQFLKGHWQHVSEASGQEFNYGLFKKESFNYDTEPVCRAVSIVKHIEKSKVLCFYRNVQHGFYVENKDPNELKFYESICNKLNVDFSRFSELFNSEAGKILVNTDFQKTQEYGVTGFPTLALQTNNRLVSIVQGYSTFEGMKERIESSLIT